MTVIRFQKYWFHLYELCVRDYMRPPFSKIDEQTRLDLIIKHNKKIWNRVMVTPIICRHLIPWYINHLHHIHFLTSIHGSSDRANYKHKATSASPTRGV